MAGLVFKWLSVPGGAMEEKEAALFSKLGIILEVLHGDSKSELADDQRWVMG